MYYFRQFLKPFQRYTLVTNQRFYPESQTNLVSFQTSLKYVEHQNLVRTSVMDYPKSSTLHLHKKIRFKLSTFENRQTYTAKFNIDNVCISLFIYILKRRIIHT